jgi:hypothetical protein
MNVGMLFHDDNKETTFAQKVKVAKERFNKKYSAKYGLCNTCYVNPIMIKEEMIVEGITVKQSKTIMKGCFWIGNNNEQKRID